MKKKGFLGTILWIIIFIILITLAIFYFKLKSTTSAILDNQFIKELSNSSGEEIISIEQIPTNNTDLAGDISDANNTNQPDNIPDTNKTNSTYVDLANAK